MSDYISKEWIKNAIHNFFRGLNHTVTEEDIQAYLDATPNADVRENVHGEWINAKVGRFFPSNDFKCSNCGNILNFDGLNCGRGDANFCPNCGADMRGE